jgi:hypothetical protein
MKKKSDLEIKREAWHKELATSTVFANGVRVNDALVGRIQSIREFIPETSKSIIRVQSSTSRPVDFKNNIFAWLRAVRAEARKMVRGELSPLRKVAA